MKIQLIRNATMRIEYAGKIFLTDPMLSKKGAFQSFAGIEPNPTVELSVKPEEILAGVDALLVSHAHPDHLDETAVGMLDKDLPIITQKFDEETIKNYGFKNITFVEESAGFEGVKISKTGGLHGSGEILQMMGEVSGFVLQAENEPTIYWAGDVVYGPEIEKAIETYKPDYIITHSGGAQVPGCPKILMDVEETIKVAKKAPNAKVIAIHMDSLDHCQTTREIMKNAIDDAGMNDSFFVPTDGETLLIDN